MDGSPRLSRAAEIWIDNPQLRSSEALIRARYSYSEANERKRQQNLYAKRKRLIKRRRLDAPSIIPLTVINTNSAAVISSHKEDVSREKKIAKKKAIVMKCKRSKQLANSSRRTSHQKNQADRELKEAKITGMNLYTQAVKLCEDRDKGVSVDEVLRENNFDLDVVKANTVRKLLREGKETITGRGRKSVLSEDDLHAIEEALFSYIKASQMNGDDEIKDATLIRLLTNLFRGTVHENKITDMSSFLRRIKERNADLFDVSKEMLIELRRQNWTTFSHLEKWYNGFETFCLSLGFAYKVGDEVVFTDASKKRIINLDESNLSLDGSDGLRGGRPASSIIARGVNRIGTAQNKSSVSSTIICGSNAFGEAMPIHIVYSSDATDETRFSVNTDWLQGLPKVECTFGMEKSQTLGATVSVNEKGGSDARVLKDVLIKYIERLYPDIADTAGEFFLR